jgi:hypothetical protein
MDKKLRKVIPEVFGTPQHIGSSSQYKPQQNIKTTFGNKDAG